MRPLITKRISLLVTTALIANTTFANGFRPVGRADTAPKTEGTNIVQVVDQAFKAKVLKNFESNSAFKGMDETAIRLFAENLGNESFSRAFNSSIKILDMAQNNPMIADIEKLKLEILPMVKDMDIFNQNKRTEASQSPEKYASYLIMRMCIEVNPLAIGHDGQQLLKDFLTELKQSLSAASTIDSALTQTIEFLQMEKGLSFNKEDIPVAATSTDGLTGLFKGANDIKEYEVGTYGDQKIIVRMTQKEADRTWQLAEGEAANMIEIASNPATLDSRFASQALQGLKAESRSTNDFIEKNGLLNKTEKYMSGADVANKTAQNLDEMLLQLKNLGAEIDSNASISKTGNWLKRKSGLDALGRKLVKSDNKTVSKIGDSLKEDPGAEFRKLTIRTKIDAIDKSIVDGMTELDSNNKDLNNLRAHAIEHTQKLNIEIARIRAVSDQIQEYIKAYETEKPELTKTLRAEIVPRIERELNSVLALYGILRASVDSIDAVIKNNLQIIADAAHLRNIAAPAITVTEAVTQAAINAHQAMQRHKQISAFISDRMTVMVDKTKEVNKVFTEMAGSSTIDPVTLDKVLGDLVKDKEETTNRLVAAGKKLRETNEKLAKTLNKYNKDLHSQSVGVTADSLIQSSRQ